MFVCAFYFFLVGSLYWADGSARPVLQSVRMAAQ